MGAHASSLLQKENLRVVGAGGVLGRDALFVCAAAALYV
jgi:hypothetical protein